MSIACLLFMGCATGGALTIHVDAARGDDSNDGFSPGRALRTIRKALDCARDGSTVIVADGIYRGEDNRELDFKGKSLHLKSAGGYEKCIIDCENEGRAFLFHCGETGDAVVEGFTVRNGNVTHTVEFSMVYEIDADLPRGGGVLCICSSPTIKDCRFTNNKAKCGGGIYCYQSSPLISGCVFENHHSGETLAFQQQSAPTVQKCSFTNNSWAAYCSQSSVKVAGCVVASQGGRGFTFNDCKAEVRRCAISGTKEGCCVSSVDGADVIVTECRMRSFGEYAVYCGDAAITLAKCSISGCSGTAVHGRTATINVSDCRIEDNKGEGFDCLECTLTVSNSTVTGNSGVGGIDCCEKSSVTLVNCLIANNTGWGVSCVNYSRLTIADCTIACNKGKYESGGIDIGGFTHSVIHNSIIWGNKDWGACDVSVSKGSTLALSHCVVPDESDNEDNSDNEGTLTKKSCKHDDPKFVDSDKRKYGLQKSSPCIDAGENSLVPKGAETDLDGKPRVIDGNGDGKAVVDIGAYEYQKR